MIDTLKGKLGIEHPGAYETCGLFARIVQRILRTKFDGPLFRAKTLLDIGDVYRLLDDVSAARKAFEEALTIFEETDHPLAEEARKRLSLLSLKNPTPSRRGEVQRSPGTCPQ